MNVEFMCFWTMRKTSWLIYLTNFVFIVAILSVKHTRVLMCCASIATSMIDVVIAIVDCSSSNIDYFFSILMLFIRNNVIISNYVNSESLFTSVITILNGLLNICIILTKFFIHCGMRLKNACTSYYKFMYQYHCLINHSSMPLPSINQVEWINCNIIELIESNFKHTKDKNGQNKSQSGENNHSHDSVYCWLMNYSLMLVMDVVGIINLFDVVMDHVCIENQTSTNGFSAIIIDVVGYVIMMIHLVLDRRYLVFGKPA